jgi:hypothetical protein
MKTNPINPTGSFSSIRVIRGHALIVQQRKDDREQFTELLIQLRGLETRADTDSLEYYYRHLNAVSIGLSRKLRDGEKNLVNEEMIGV